MPFALFHEIGFITILIAIHRSPVSIGPDIAFPYPKKVIPPIVSETSVIVTIRDGISMVS